MFVIKKVEQFSIHPTENPILQIFRACLFQSSGCIMPPFCQQKRLNLKASKLI